MTYGEHIHGTVAGALAWLMALGYHLLGSPTWTYVAMLVFTLVYGVYQARRAGKQ